MPWHPVAFAIAFVVGSHIETRLHPYASLRALLVVPAIALGVQVAITAALRDRHRASVVTSVVVLIFMVWPGIRTVLAVPQLGPRLLLFLPSLILLAAAIVQRRRRRSGQPLVRLQASTLSAGLGTLAVVILLVVAVRGLLDGVFVQDVADLTERPATAESAVPAVGPDIYVIVLDGHPRVDTLARLFSYDGSGFLDALEARGFDVASGSRSNYPESELTFPSMFHMRLVDEIDALRGLTTGKVGRDPAVRLAINHNPVFEFLRGQGYQIVTSASPYELGALRSADVYLDDGQVNWLEFRMISATPLLELLNLLSADFLGTVQRSRLQSNFRHLAELAHGRDEGPRFIFAYVNAPHLPVVFGPNGEPIQTENVVTFYDDADVARRVSAEDFATRYVGQVRYIDSRAIELVDEIIAHASPPPVIILMSDHGSRSRFLFGDPEHSDADEALSILFAARTPGHDDLFPPDITPVNVFPILLKAYFGADFATSPDRTFIPRGYLDLNEVPNPDDED